MSPPQLEPQPLAGPLGLPRTYWVLWLGMLVNRLGGGVFPFLAIYLTTARGLSPATAGMVFGLFAGGGMVAGPVGGLIADRVGRKATMLASTVLSATVMLALGFARGLWALALLAALLGFVNDLYRPALQAAVADLVAPADRRRAYGMLYWATNLGFAGAATLAGRLAAWNFTWLFVIDAATTLAFGAMVLAAVRETRPARDLAQEPHFVRELAVPFLDRSFQVFALIQLAVLIVFLQFTVAFPLDMNAHGLNPKMVGNIIALNGIVIITLQPLALRLTLRTSHHHLLSVGAAFVGLGFGLAALAGGAPVYALALVTFTLGEIGFSTAAPALVANLASPAHRGGYMGAHQLIWGLAGVIAPVIGPLVLQRFGAPTLWLGCAAVGLAAAGLHATVTGRFARDRAQPPPS